MRRLSGETGEKLEYKIIAKEEIPPEEPVVTERSILVNLLKTLPLNKAIYIKCTSDADWKRKKVMVAGISTTLRKRERCKLVTQTKEESLSPKRQEAFSRSEHKGTFHRGFYLYVWKEQLD